MFLTGVAAAAAAVTEAISRLQAAVASAFVKRAGAARASSAPAPRTAFLLFVVLFMENSPFVIKIRSLLRIVIDVTPRGWRRRRPSAPPAAGCARCRRERAGART